MTILEPTVLEEIQEFLRDNPYAVLYVSRPGCGICSAIKPKILEITGSLEHARFCSLDLDLIPAAAGEYSVFTIPAILVYVDGRESIREARYLSMDDLRARMERLHALRFGSEAPS